ncbi:MAG: YdgA family protein, partial [Leptolyngbya sp. SIO1D8]|nr:YdgA family protein [Leptolyngbya sp. SIO1D8]
MGTFNNPGFLITNGSLTSFNIGVSGDFDLKAITITTSDLTFQWDSGNSQFEMFGSASTNIDGNGISISLGDEDDPGLIVNSGTVTHINFGITADFDMKGITISPNDLTLEYDLGNTQYEFYGSVA